MEEEVTQKTIALAIRTTKLTADVLRRALAKFLEAQMDIPFKKCTLFGILVHPYPVKKCNRYRIVGAVTD